MSPEGTLIPSILLPAHFMPCSALIDVKIVRQILEYQCVCLRVCLFACSTHLLICFCVCASVLFLFVCIFLNYFILMLYLASSAEPPVCATSERRCSRDTSPRWKERRLFYVCATFKLHELVIVLWLIFGKLIENELNTLFVCMCVGDQKLIGRKRCDLFRCHWFLWGTIFENLFDWRDKTLGLML